MTKILTVALMVSALALSACSGWTHKGDDGYGSKTFDKHMAK